jgi:hypothetical protein
MTQLLTRILATQKISQQRKSPYFTGFSLTSVVWRETKAAKSPLFAGLCGEEKIVLNQ